MSLGGLILFCLLSGLASWAQPGGQIPPPPPPPPLPQATPLAATTTPPAPSGNESNVMNNPKSIDNTKVTPEGRKVIEGIGDFFVYVENDRRDPFVPFSVPRPNTGTEELTWLQRFEIDQLALIGIIWDVRKPKCMFVDPNGRTHVVGRNEKIGIRGGYIAEIRENEVVIVEKMKTAGLVSFQTRVVKLTK